MGLGPVGSGYEGLLRCCEAEEVPADSPFRGACRFVSPAPDVQELSALHPDIAVDKVEFPKRLKNTTLSSRRTGHDRSASPVDRLRVHNPVVADLSRDGDGGLPARSEDDPAGEGAAVGRHS